MTEPTLSDCINYMKQQLNGMEKYPKSYEFNIPYYRKTIEYLEEGRPHGEWEFIGENLFKCTNCGYIADANYLRRWKVHTYDAEFPTACLKCGADMRKER